MDPSPAPPRKSCVDHRFERINPRWLAFDLSKVIHHPPGKRGSVLYAHRFNYDEVPFKRNEYHRIMMDKDMPKDKKRTARQKIHLLLDQFAPAKALQWLNKDPINRKGAVVGDLANLYLPLYLPGGRVRARWVKNKGIALFATKPIPKGAALDELKPLYSTPMRLPDDHPVTFTAVTVERFHNPEKTCVCGKFFALEEECPKCVREFLSACEGNPCGEDWDGCKCKCECPRTSYESIVFGPYAMMNSNCENHPNVFFRGYVKGEIPSARFDIARGEELTICYGREISTEFGCSFPGCEKNPVVQKALLEDHGALHDSPPPKKKRHQRKN